MERLVEFIRKAKIKHPGENLDYSKVVYVDSKTPVCIIDRDLDEDGNEYGEYWQTPSNHLKGHSHPKKRSKKIQCSKKYDFNKLIERFKMVHNGENLDYSKASYVNMHTPILIIDHDTDSCGNEYGEYWQEPNAHLRGSGHPRKSREKSLSERVMTTDEIIEKFKNVHGDNYDYRLTEYKGYRTPVSIICRKHGTFQQTPECHLSGKGCQKCGNHYSKYDDDISIMLENEGVTVIKHDRSILEGKEIDIYCPEKKIGIEFNGLRWHSEWFGGKDRNYHLSKTEDCERNGIRLIQVFEDEYVRNRELVNEKIRHILGVTTPKRKVMGRKCMVREIDKDTAKRFLETNHIQGYSKSTVYAGAHENDLLVGVMTFVRSGNEWELNRFATDTGVVCCGIGGKMFKWFVNEYKPSYVKSFADRRWSSTINGNIYETIGFRLESICKPDYRYIGVQGRRYERCHKFGFRKQILHKKYGLPLSMTETEMIKELGYDRIWDCGLLKYVWRNNDERTE